jgi:hypothetical protein
MQSAASANDRLYQPGGILAVWSSGPNLKFTGRRLCKASFEVEEIKVRANGSGGGHGM